MFEATDAFFEVLQTFESQTDEDLGAKVSNMRDNLIAP